MCFTQHTVLKRLESTEPTFEARLVFEARLLIEARLLWIQINPCWLVETACWRVMETGHPSTRAVNSGSGNRALYKNCTRLSRNWDHGLNWCALWLSYRFSTSLLTHQSTVQRHCLKSTSTIDSGTSEIRQLGYTDDWADLVTSYQLAYHLHQIADDSPPRYWLYTKISSVSSSSSSSSKYL